METPLAEVDLERAMANSKALANGLRVLVFRGSSRFVAQSLEYDLNAQADTIEGAFAAFARVFVAAVAADMALGRKPLSTKRPAPPHFAELFEGAEKYERSLKSEPPDEGETREPIGSIRPELEARVLCTA